MPNNDDFQKELDVIFSFAEEKSLSAVVIKAGDLQKLVRGMSGSDHRIPNCCRVMRKNMKDYDEVLSQPPSVRGPTLTIKYKFPRK
jgi:hypothetical protein